MRSKLVWSFSTANFRVECRFSPDDDVDTSFDETGETAENLRSGLWQAFCTEVRVIHKGTDIVLGKDSLCGSIYERPRDFLKVHMGARGRSGSYFVDMVRAAVAEARRNRREIGWLRAPKEA